MVVTTESQAKKIIGKNLSRLCISPIWVITTGIQIDIVTDRRNEPLQALDRQDSLGWQPLLQVNLDLPTTGTRR